MPWRNNGVDYFRIQKTNTMKLSPKDIALKNAAASLRYCLTVIPSSDPLYSKIAASEEAARKLAPSGPIRSAIVYEMRAKIRQSFNQWGHMTEDGYFEFSPAGRLTGWMPDLLGASLVQPGTIRVKQTGAEVYWIAENGEFTAHDE